MPPSVTAAMSSSGYKIQNTYKTLVRLIQNMPKEQNTKTLERMRTEFRRPLAEHETIDDRLHEAGQRIAYLRIITPHSSKGGRWVYKDGQKVEGGQETATTGGRVVSNWDGKNLDPDSVKRHQQSLKRAGFANNLHAKGIF